MCVELDSLRPKLASLEPKLASLEPELESSLQNTPTMSSREIATLCDKRHSDVKRDIDVMAEQLEIDVRKFAHIYLYP